SEAMANKYKISSRRVYQIWRGVHPEIDPKNINPFSEEPGSPQQADISAEIFFRLKSAI
ncbi:3018_t:CDS:2, partial [Funneliformis geosporum]